MGLDMYLEKNIFIGAMYEHRGVTGSIDIKVAGNPVAINFSKVSTITEQAAYWRKANAIHRWFVDKVQGGEDDCKRHYVEKEALVELVTLCKKILDNPSLAPELLPTQGGFFFGGTAYGEDYMYDIRTTIDQLAPIIEAEDHADYYYCASW